MATNGTKSKMNMHNMKKKYLIKFFLRYITRIFALSRKKNWQQPTRCLSNHGMLIYIEEKNEIFLLNT